ncbi:MAG: hypothetical protein WCE71_22425, partial [Pseudonocardiaceae bacterium]
AHQACRTSSSAAPTAPAVAGRDTTLDNAPRPPSALRELYLAVRKPDNLRVDNIRSRLVSGEGEGPRWGYWPGRQPW